MRCLTLLVFLFLVVPVMAQKRAAFRRAALSISLMLSTRTVFTGPRRSRSNSKLILKA